MNEMIFQIPGSISKVTTMSRNTLRIQFDSQETLSPESMKRMFELIDKLGWMTVSAREIEPADIINLPELRPTDEEKTPAQIQRAIIYRMWEKNNEGFKEPEGHYRYYMQKIADWLKQKLNIGNEYE